MRNSWHLQYLRLVAIQSIIILIMDFTSIRLITFDCYGTLIDWETGMLSSLRSLLRNAPAVEDEKLLEMYGEIEAQIEAGPYVTYRAVLGRAAEEIGRPLGAPLNAADAQASADLFGDRKSTRLNSSHLVISYAVFCL